MVSLSVFLQETDGHTGRSVAIFVWAILLRMGLVVALAFYMLRASLAQAAAVLALRDGAAFLIDVDQRTV
jgi:type VI protein secretion system component VasF